MSEQASKVSGVVQIDSSPAERTVRAYGYESQEHAIDGETVTLSRSLGHATSAPETGEYTINLLGGYDKQVFVVAFDDYGGEFTPDMSVAVGDRIHPTTPNGYVFECTGVGTLPSDEPTWVVDTETAQIYGTASMIARPFYRPMVHGPVTPEVTQVAVTFPYYDLVMDTAVAYWRLSDADEPFADEVGGTALTIEGSVQPGVDPLTGDATSTAVGFSQSGKLGGAGSPFYELIIAEGQSEFTIEAWFMLSSVGAAHGNGVIYAERAINGDKPMQIQYVGGSDYLLIDKNPESGGSLESSTGWSTDTVYHMVYTETATSRRLYINGVLDSGDEAPEDYSGSPGAVFSIGGRALDLNNLFDGVIGEVSLHPVAFTAQQALDRYNAGIAEFTGI